MNTENIKIQRINADILRVLSVAIHQKAKDEELDFVTILRVETSADLSEAKIYVTVAGDKNKGMNALEQSSGFLRNEIAQNIRMKQTPKLRFILDKGVENAARVEELLAQINGGHHDCANCPMGCKRH